MSGEGQGEGSQQLPGRQKLAGGEPGALRQSQRDKAVPEQPEQQMLCELSVL